MTQRLVHGAAFSTCTQRVMFAAAEANIDVKLVNVDFFKGEHKTPQYLENLQPFGVMPVYEELNDKGERQFKIYESRAIGRYFNQISGGKLIPKDAHAYGLFEQFAYTEVETGTPIFSTVVAERVFKKFRNLEADEEVIKSKIAPLHTLCGVLSKQLKSTQNYLVGEFSLVDIYYTPYMQHFSTLPEWEVVKEYPEVVAWFNRIVARPAWQKVLDASKMH